MNPKVAHVLRKYDPAQWGGTETHVAAVTALLGPRGWPCEVHAPRGPKARDHALAPDVPLIRYRAFLPYAGRAERRRALVANAGNIVSIEELLRLANDRELGLAHLHTMGRIGGAVRTAMRMRGLPYVISVHGPLLASPDWLEEETRRRVTRTLDLGKPFGALLGARRVLDEAARVITFNEAEREAIAARIGDRAVRMDHGVDLERFASGDAERARRRFPELGDGPVVGLVGRVCSQKNQVLAVRAFANAAPADWHLALAGAATDFGYREQVERTARALGVADRVHLLGNIDAADVPDLYARSTVMLVPSTHEAFGLIVLEAMAAARPVVFARHSGLADIARALRDDACTVGTLDAEAWSGALGRFVADPHLRARAVEAGLRLVRERYCWDRVADRLAALYAEVTEERSPRPPRGQARSRPGRRARHAAADRP